jgi:hypothetical protein
MATAAQAAKNFRRMMRAQRRSRRKVGNDVKGRGSSSGGGPSVSRGTLQRSSAPKPVDWTSGEIPRAQRVAHDRALNRSPRYRTRGGLRASDFRLARARYAEERGLGHRTSTWSRSEVERARRRGFFTTDRNAGQSAAFRRALRRGRQQLRAAETPQPGGKKSPPKPNQFRSPNAGMPENVPGQGIWIPGVGHMTSEQYAEYLRRRRRGSPARASSGD